MATLELTQSVTKKGLDDLEPVKVLSEYGFKYETFGELQADKRTYMEKVRHVLFVRFKVDGEDRIRELTKVMTPTQFNTLTGKQIETLILNHIKSELNI